MIYVKKQTKKNELMHYGVKGQKWGVRNYQNPDGTLTSQGKAHYADKYSTNLLDSKGKLSEAGRKRLKAAVEVDAEAQANLKNYSGKNKKQRKELIDYANLASADVSGVFRKILDNKVYNSKALRNMSRKQDFGGTKYNETVKKLFKDALGDIDDYTKELGDRFVNHYLADYMDQNIWDDWMVEDGHNYYE